MRSKKPMKLNEIHNSCSHDSYVVHKQLSPKMWRILCYYFDLFLLQFADDSKFFRRIKTYHDMFEMQKRTDQVSNWCRTNKVSINPTQSYMMSVADRYTSKLRTVHFINGQKIEAVEQHKDLGVYFDVN